MRFDIRLFANVKEIAGRDKLELDVPDDATVADVLHALKEAYPELHDALEHVMVAVNLELAHPSRRVLATDEIALIPPVGGGEGEHPYARLTREPLDVKEAEALLSDARHGGCVLFLGTVRAWTGHRQTERIEYEAYEAMVRVQLEQLVTEIEQEFAGVKALVWHRIGTLYPEDVAVICGAAHPHRKAAFEACQALIDRLKARVAIWKKEFFADGSAEWRPNP
ncbi:molybdenum cofactor biosynthesis protein [Alicyclobacillus acidocaldarius]|uniref:Molybdopterin converting factor, subunit 1 n=1 Tax=Alicyclobacillus acidocaldarius subsp. acidocaldarius (strain ATCC 27009 / DSM 446 / BCRC 14685 / JCM 5260 / KCTC 1825 / NBRC 15652 / NCIMB 11725 / NRRL B-14509 / 104-IA) TaxID=521098 RepID=C8WXE9_ALIAD|nr:molybdenum cofactor biosynthesis protein MoaE [Alicyclobacillus acidocaldarius]ACV58771.1 molybdopterin converting factor, subunit 1 [Alicyclobacillus acidocaldarius subsp. acidocaldarius DSM 446]